jgi:hypothetical protein
MEARSRPWYKEPWPWVAIAIPLAAVIMGFITLYLAVSHPDYLVVEKEQYQEINSELRAQPSPGDSPAAGTDSQAGSEDGEH